MAFHKVYKKVDNRYFPQTITGWISARQQPSRPDIQSFDPAKVDKIEKSNQFNSSPEPLKSKNDYTVIQAESSENDSRANLLDESGSSHLLLDPKTQLQREMEAETEQANNNPYNSE